ncbi:capping protein, Arp2/3 and myosin-I linker protein 2 isoform X3 [Oncorhynchus mykiss]|uniref:capping protein, Arp2/3 and myosin-I linker protein 2 isoform X3 n=1 Tax=Oncorhynchus mykiss TaxID=8022 RepID=UPI001878322F|nr:capping protein, Arp2/3 and myosin-I linker protein 2 isoform X3 [Oncorhynchus mykiss]
MELPLGVPALRHYTRSRPRPHRQNQHLRPSRPQESVVDNENGVPDHMGRVDEGVEEFFTKRVLPVDTLKTQNEAGEPSITEQEVEVAPTSAAPCPAPSRTLRRKLGEFFTLKKRRAVKSEGSQEGKAKKTSIADLIRPLREAARAEKDKVKENEKVKEKESVDDNVVTGDPVEAETPSSDGPTPLRGEAPPRRALREGKSQSLILLSGSAANAGNTKNTAQGKFQKHSSDGHHGFEQRLQLMLQRIGVSKAQPGETQSQEREMKKAESEGTIIDNKPDPPPTFMKPRTMSTSSDTRRPVRQSVSAHESAGKPALPPKPIIKRGPTPPPTVSGHLTPENDLAQIQEVEMT